MPWWKGLKYLPFIMALGIGMCVNQSKAVIEAMVGLRDRLHPHAQDRDAGPRAQLAPAPVSHAGHRAGRSSSWRWGRT